MRGMDLKMVCSAARRDDPRVNVNVLLNADVRSPLSMVAPAVVERVGVGGVDSFRLKGAKP